jgi:hypothetical protein
MKKLLFALLFALPFVADAQPGRNRAGDDAERSEFRRRRGRDACSDCREPLSLYIFNREYVEFLQLRPFEREAELRRYTRFNCLRTEQVRQLAMLLESERSKTEFLTFVFTSQRLYDPQRFYRASTVFASRAAQEGFIRFLRRENLPCGRERYDDYSDYEYGDDDDDDRGRGRGRGGRGDDGGRVLPPTTSNYMRDDDFSSLVESVRSESIDSRKLDKAKFVLSSGRQLSARQIATLAKLFTYDTNRLNFSKYAYDFCYERQNYLQVVDTLDYETSKRDLLRYLETRR